jgi:long-chain fatty acid transport protein
MFLEKKMTNLKMKTVRIAVLVALGAGGTMAHAGGFALAEQSIAAMGMANAGTAAMVMDDASTVFYNPAGMARLSSINVAQGLHVITLNSSFKDQGSVAGLGQPLATNEIGPGKVGEATPVPTFFAAMPINKSLAFGVGVSAPFGLKTEYNPGWSGRYQAIISDVKSYNFNPSLSMRLSDQLSLGLGANFMRFQAKLTNNVNYTAVALRGLTQQGTPAATIQQLTPLLVGREGDVVVKGQDNGYGFNGGALFELNKDTRVGLSFRSAIKFQLQGDVKFKRPSTANLPASIAGSVALIQNVGTPDGPVTVDLKTPASVSLSGVTKITPRLELAGDATWTQWSNVPELKIVRSTGVTLTQVEYDWQNTMRYALGVTYDYGTGIKARAGLAYDEAPVQDVLRTARLPDNNRTWLSVGGSYQVNPKLRLDGAFTHILVKKSGINDNLSASGAGIVKGEYSGSVNIISAGLVMTF